MNLREKFIHDNNAMVMENSMRGWISVLTLMILCTWASPVHAWMWEVGDEELSEVTGEGFSSFTLTDIGSDTNVAHASFNINVSTYTQIDSLKMGYYTRADLNGTPTPGWDEDWTNVSIGTSLEDVKIKGVYIEAQFSNINTPEARQLDYIKVGTHDLSGDIRATFNSFSGSITRQDGTVYRSGYRITDMGTRTLTGHNSEFSVRLDRTGGPSGSGGWWVEMDKASIN
jgi:hypothetical protein